MDAGYYIGNPVFDIENRIWFESGAGVIWLDLETEKWCLTSNYPMSIVSDGEKVWGFINNELYLYDLDP